MSGFSRKHQFDEAANRKQAAAIHVGALVKVIRYDPVAMRVDVKPLAQPLEGGEYGAPTQVLAAPIAGTRSGGFLLRPWIEAGDVGTVQYLDHDMDDQLEKGEECKPNTERNHSDTDAVFLGGVVDGRHEAPEIPDGLALCTEDGEIFLVITKNDIQIKGDLYVQGSITVTGGDVVADGISLKNHTHGCPHGGETTPPH